MAMRRINRRLRALAEARAQTFDSIGALDARLDVPAARYRELLEPMWMARGDARDVYIEAVFEMRAAMSETEWQQAFGSR